MHMDICNEAVVAIRQSYALLAKERNLSPHNEKVNHSLTRLVRTLTQCQAQDVTDFLLTTPSLSEEREKLPMLCGQAECEMEKFWARKLIAREDSHLNEFWYYPEYQELCRAEKELFAGRRFSTISFLGAGALPLTAFLLAHNVQDAKIVCVDVDAEACDLADRLSEKLGLSRRVDIRCMDALQYDPADNELVICASLLRGGTQVYKRLRNHHNGALMVRDSEGAYQFLYKAAELPRAGFREVAKTTRDPRRINTSRYYEPEEAFNASAAA